MLRRRFYPEPPSRKPEPRFKQGRDQDFLSWLRRQPCCISGVSSGDLITVTFPSGRTARMLAIIEASHVRSRGAGGEDKGNTVPMELSEHRRIHRIGIKTYQREKGIDLKAMALRYAERYDAERGPTEGG